MSSELTTLPNLPVASVVSNHSGTEVNQPLHVRADPEDMKHLHGSGLQTTEALHQHLAEHPEAYHPALLPYIERFLGSRALGESTSEEIDPTNNSSQNGTEINPEIAILRALQATGDHDEPLPPDATGIRPTGQHMLELLKDPQLPQELILGARLILQNGTIQERRTLVLLDAIDILEEAHEAVGLYDEAETRNFKRENLVTEKLRELDSLRALDAIPSPHTSASKMINRLETGGKVSVFLLQDLAEQLFEETIDDLEPTEAFRLAQQLDVRWCYHDPRILERIINRFELIIDPIQKFKAISSMVEEVSRLGSLIEHIDVDLEARFKNEGLSLVNLKSIYTHLSSRLVDNLPPFASEIIFSDSKPGSVNTYGLQSVISLVNKGFTPDAAGGLYKLDHNVDFDINKVLENLPQDQLEQIGLLVLNPSEEAQQLIHMVHGDRSRILGIESKIKVLVGLQKFSEDDIKFLFEDDTNSRDVIVETLCWAEWQEIEKFSHALDLISQSTVCRQLLQLPQLYREFKKMLETLGGTESMPPALIEFLHLPSVVEAFTSERLNGGRYVSFTDCVFDGAEMEATQTVLVDLNKLFSRPKLRTVLEDEILGPETISYLFRVHANKFSNTTYEDLVLNAEMIESFATEPDILNYLHIIASNNPEVLQFFRLREFLIYGDEDINPHKSLLEVLANIEPGSLRPGDERYFQAGLGGLRKIETLVKAGLLEDLRSIPALAHARDKVLIWWERTDILLEEDRLSILRSPKLQALLDFQHTHQNVSWMTRGILEGDADLTKDNLLAKIEQRYQLITDKEFVDMLDQGGPLVQNGYLIVNQPDLLVAKDRYKRLLRDYSGTMNQLSSDTGLFFTTMEIALASSDIDSYMKEVQLVIEQTNLTSALRDYGHFSYIYGEIIKKFGTTEHPLELAKSIDQRLELFDQLLENPLIRNEESSAAAIISKLLAAGNDEMAQHIVARLRMLSDQPALVNLFSKNEVLINSEVYLTQLLEVSDEHLPAYVTALQKGESIVGVDFISPAVVRQFFLVGTNQLTELDDYLRTVITKQGEAGYSQLSEVVRSVIREVTEGTIDGDKIVQSPLLISLLKNIVRYDASEFGSHSNERLLKLFDNVAEARSRGLTGLASGYEPREVQIATLDQQEKDEFTPTKDAVSQWTVFATDIKQALAQRETKNTKSTVDEELGRTINQRISAIERGLIKMNEKLVQAPDNARLKIQIKITEQQAELAILQNLGSQQLASLRQFFTNFGILSKYDEAKPALRQILFRKALQRFPQVAEGFRERLAEDRPPTLRDLEQMADFTSHLTARETWSRRFQRKGILKVLENLVDSEAINQDITRSLSIGRSGTRSFRFVPSRGELLELSGDIADACWTEKYGLISETMPNITSVTFIQNPDTKNARLVGAGLLMEAVSMKGEPLLVIRGLNPIQNTITQLQVDDFWRAFSDYARTIADKQGRRLAVVIDDHSGGAATNRPTLFNWLANKKKEWESVPLADDPQTTFNNYDIRNDTYLVG